MLNEECSVNIRSANRLAKRQFAKVDNASRGSTAIDLIEQAGAEMK
jgi:hypothetical protein